MREGVPDVLLFLFPDVEAFQVDSPFKLLFEEGDAAFQQCDPAFEHRDLVLFLVDMRRPGNFRISEMAVSPTNRKASKIPNFFEFLLAIAFSSVIITVVALVFRSKTTFVSEIGHLEYLFRTKPF